jgi:hypothetical protein
MQFAIAVREIYHGGQDQHASTYKKNWFGDNLVT